MPRRGSVVWLAFAASLTAANSASAQTADPTIGQITSNTVRRTAITRTTATNAISAADCAAGDAFEFPLNISNFSTGWELEIWVGVADCNSDVARGIGGVATCGLVYRSASVSVPTTTVKISDAAILTAIRTKSTEVDPNPTCQAPDVGAGIQNASILFLFTRQGGTVKAGMQPVSFIQFAMNGPSPPINVVAGVANNALKVSWSQNTDSTVIGYYVFCDPKPGTEGTPRPISGSSIGVTRWAQETSESDGGNGGDDAATPTPQGIADAGVDVSVEASEAGADGGDEAGAAPDAGTAPDASQNGADTGASTAPNDAGGADGAEAGDGSVSDAGEAPVSTVCGDVLTAGADASKLLSTNLCGVVYGNGTTNTIISGLQNHFSYSVAVASFDTLSNVGQLSQPFCNPALTTPRETIGFYEQYVDAGGTALQDSSLCSIGSVGQNSKRSSWAGGVMMAMAFGLALARRTKRRQ